MKTNVDHPPSTEAVITSLLLVHTHTVLVVVACRIPACALPTRPEDVLEIGLPPEIVEVALESVMLLSEPVRNMSPETTRIDDKVRWLFEVTHSVDEATRAGHKFKTYYNAERD